MKYKIINYYFKHQGETYIFASYDEALTKAVNILGVPASKLPHEFIYHIVKEYES